MRTFKENICNIFNKYAPIKKKYVGAKKAPFMTKELHKAIMKKFILRNKFLKDGTETNQKKFKLHRNFCKKLMRTSKIYYSNLDIKKFTDNKTSWKTITPLSTQVPLKGEKINLIENGKNISNDTELCNIFNGFFPNIISDLNIPKNYHRFLNDMDYDELKHADVIPVHKKNEKCDKTN